MQYEVKGAKHVVARLLSSTALAVLEVYQTSAEVHLFAYHSKLEGREEEPLAFPVARYALPALPNGFTYITAHFDCSPASLSGCRKDRRNHHLLEDGAGIFSLTLEIQSWYPSLTAAQEADTSGDVHVSWDFMTAIVLNDAFHQAAKKALTSLDREGTIPTVGFSTWASKSLSWLPVHNFAHSRNSICGYRLAMTDDPSTEGSAGIGNFEVGANQQHKSVSIYDFTPAHVMEALSKATEGRSDGEGSATVDVSSSWAIPPSHSHPSGSMYETCDKTVMKQSAPLVASRALSEALAKYGTYSPFIVSTRNVPISPPDLRSVVHLAHRYLLFAQVRGFQTSWKCRPRRLYRLLI